MSVQQPDSDVPAVDVVYVVASMITGGTQTHLLQVLRRLDRDRYRPHLFCLRDEGNLIQTVRELDVPVHTFGMHGSLRDPRDLLGLLRMVAALRALRPGIVHGYLLRGNFYAAVAARLAGISVVVTSKRGHHAPAGTVERIAVRCSNALSTTVTGNSEQVLEFTRTEEPWPPARMDMIPSGIDVARFDPDTTGCGQLRNELGLGEAPVVGTAITFRPRKGFRLLFEAVAKVRNSIPTVRLLIAGESEMPDEPAALARQLGIEQSVSLLGRRSDMPQVLRNFDVFVLPSQSEGMSNAILEAMAMARPVVATAVGAAPGVIEEGRSGFLVEYGDVEAMAAAITALLKDAERGVAVGEAARRRVLDHYSAASMVSQIEELYGSLLLAA